MNTDTATYVGADIDVQTWQRASAALAAMGMTAADAIRLTMSRIAEEGRMPFVSRAPAAQEGKNNSRLCFLRYKKKARKRDNSA